MTIEAAIGMVSLFVVVLVAVYASFRHRRVERRAESTAAKVLPELGGIAERQHERRFGKKPEGCPEWYPRRSRTPTLKRIKERHAG